MVLFHPSLPPPACSFLSVYLKSYLGLPSLRYTGFLTVLWCLTELVSTPHDAARTMHQGGKCGWLLLRGALMLHFLTKIRNPATTELERMTSSERSETCLKKIYFGGQLRKGAPQSSYCKVYSSWLLLGWTMPPSFLTCFCRVLQSARLSLSFC